MARLLHLLTCIQTRIFTCFEPSISLPIMILDGKKWESAFVAESLLAACASPSKLVVGKVHDDRRSFLDAATSCTIFSACNAVTTCLGLNKKC